MKILVTGGGGFLGQAIVRQLLAQGHTVHSYSRGHYPELKALGVIHHQGDLTDLATLLVALQGCEAVFHVAAKAGIWGAYSEFYTANVIGTERLLQACLQLGIPKLVYTSTPSVVYTRDGIEGANESLPYPTEFIAPYPETKAKAEQLVLAANQPTFSTVALRPHLIWGPGDHHFLPRLISRAKAGRLRLLGQQPNLVDSVYIENAAEAHLLALAKLAPDSPVAGKAYFITQDEPLPMADLINHILAAADLPPIQRTLSPVIAYAAGSLLEWAYRVFRLSGEPPMTRFLAKQLSTPHWFDISAAKRDFGYEPRVSLAEGMDQLKNWIQSNRNW